MEWLEQLENVRTRLQELYENYLLAKNNIDKRRRTKAIREAEAAIERYSVCIPLEIKAIFDREVGANSLNAQHADDIGLCIEILDRLIKEEKEKVVYNLQNND